MRRPIKYNCHKMLINHIMEYRNISKEKAEDWLKRLKKELDGMTDY